RGGGAKPAAGAVSSIEQWYVNCGEGRSYTRTVWIALHQAAPYGPDYLRMRSTKVAATLSPEAIDSIVYGQNGDPFALLGPHKVSVDGQPSTAIRVFLPWAQAIQIATHDGQKQDA